MKLLEEANLYLYETCIESGFVTSLETERTYAESLYDWLQTCQDNDWRWDEVSKVEVILYRERMLELPSPLTGRPYSRRTINQRLGAVCRFYDWSYRKGFIEHVPFSFRTIRYRPPANRHAMTHLGPSTRETNALNIRVRQRPVRSLSPGDLSEILSRLGPNSARPGRDRLMAECAVVTGMRRKEVCALTLDQIPQTRERLARMVLTITKGDIERAVFPPSQFLDRLRWYTDIDRKRIVRAAKYRLKDAYSEPREVFLTNRGTPIQLSHLTAIYRDAARQAQVESSFHDLRHTFALTMFRQLNKNSELNPWKTLQVILGHAQMSTTVDTYLAALAADEFLLGDSVEAMYDAALRRTGP